MGIYTDYGRFMKAREFKNWCNSGAGIWFGFSIGSPRWDELVTPVGGNSRPFVPPSQPAAYTPLYRWHRQYKADKDNAHDWASLYDLQPQEMELLDRSFGTDEAPSGSGLTPPCYPDNAQIKNDPDCPTDYMSPAINVYHNDLETLETFLWQGMDTPTRQYPSPFIPPFPVSYRKDWISRDDSTGIIPDYIVADRGGFDPSIEPTDSSQYLSFAYNYHIYKGIHQIGGQPVSEVPLGLLSFIQGSAQFVEPLEREESDTPLDTIRTFKYGSHYWRIVQDSQIDRNNLPHFVLLTVSVFPNELALSSLVENQLPVRQVTVFKFPDSLVQTLILNMTPLPRSSQVLRRERINIVTRDPSTGNPSYQYSDGNPDGIVNIPIHCQNPLDPNLQNSDTAEMLINDYMTARKRDVQQTDRYGYIIGF